MNFTELISKRYSARSYKKTAVEKEILYKILDAGRFAPSAANFQPWHFIIVQEKENREMINQVYHREWFKTAPVVIIICADHSQSWKRKTDNKDFAFVDAAIAIDHMTLQATELGLGTCWICNFDMLKCKELFNLPVNIEPVALLPLGYPNDEPKNKIRKNRDQIIHMESFKNS